MNILQLAKTAYAQISSWLAPSIARAHEVYVLSPEEIEASLGQPRPEFILTIQENLSQFILWGFISLLIIGSVFFISITRRLEELVDPFLLRIKKYAPFIMQITLGAALVYSAYHSALFGIELPLDLVFGTYAGAAQITIIIAGAMLLTGIFPRIASLAVLLLFIPPILERGIYMINYATYFGEAVAIFLFGGTYQLMNSNFSPLPELRRSMELHLHKYKFLLLRVTFGLSLIYASIYAKYLHGALALNTVTQYNLTEFFPFDPTFIVLGAMIIEILLGLFYIFGFEIRFASIFYLIFLVLSIIFFQEAVWPHIVLIGTALAMLTHGYDRYTIGGRLLKRGNLEPIL